MNLMINRRAFVQRAATVVSAGSMAVADTGVCGSPDAVPLGQQMKKAVKFGMIRTSGTVEEKFRLLKKLGYDGVEVMGSEGYLINQFIVSKTTRTPALP